MSQVAAKRYTSCSPTLTYGGFRCEFERPEDFSCLIGGDNFLGRMTNISIVERGIEHSGEIFEQTIEEIKDGAFVRNELDENWEVPRMDCELIVRGSVLQVRGGFVDGCERRREIHMEWTVGMSSLS